MILKRKSEPSRATEIRSFVQADFLQLKEKKRILSKDDCIDTVLKKLVTLSILQHLGSLYAVQMK